MPKPDPELIQQLLALLKGGQAHVDFETAIKDFPPEHYGTVPANLPYSAWQILEHLRITQRDILNFSAPPTGGYQHIAWPEGYWPKSPTHPHPTHGAKRSPPSAPTRSCSKHSSRIPQSTSTSPFAGATARTSSAKLSSSRTTTPTTSAN